MKEIVESIKGTMNGFFNNVATRFEGSDFVTNHRNWRDVINGYKIYVCVIDQSNFESNMRASYIPIYNYYNEGNDKYSNLVLKIDTQKVLRNLKLFHIAGLNSYQASIAFLNFISIFTDGDSQKIVEYLNEYSNLHQWYVRKDIKTTLSYGPTKEIILGERELEKRAIYNSSDYVKPIGITINLTKV